MQQLFAFSAHFPQISPCFRQVNQVADVLVNVRCSHVGEEIYFAISSLPPLARGAMCLDKLGIASIMKIPHRHVWE